MDVASASTEWAAWCSEVQAGAAWGVAKQIGAQMESPLWRGEGQGELPGGGCPSQDLKMDRSK